MNKEHFLTSVLEKHESLKKEISKFEASVLESGFQDYLDDSGHIDMDKLPEYAKRAYIERESLASYLSYPLYVHIKNASGEELQKIKDHLVDENQKLVSNAKKYFTPILENFYSFRPYIGTFKEHYGKLYFDKTKINEEIYYAYVSKYIADPSHQLNLRSIYKKFAKEEGKIEKDSEFNEELYQYYDKKIRSLVAVMRDKSPEKTLNMLYSNNVEELRSSLLAICSRDRFYFYQFENFDLTACEEFVTKIIDSTTNQNNNYQNALEKAEIYRISQSICPRLENEIYSIQANKSMGEFRVPYSIVENNARHAIYSLCDERYLNEVSATKKTLLDASNTFSYFSLDRLEILNNFLEKSNSWFANTMMSSDLFLEKQDELLKYLRFLEQVTSSNSAVFTDQENIEIKKAYELVANAPVPKEHFFGGVSRRDIQNLEGYFDICMVDGISLRHWITSNLPLVRDEVVAKLNKYADKFGMNHLGKFDVEYKLHQLSQLERTYFEEKGRYDALLNEKKNLMDQYQQDALGSLDYLSSITGFDKEKIPYFLDLYGIHRNILKEPKKDLEVYSKALLRKYREEIKEKARRIQMEEYLKSLSVTCSDNLSIEDLQELCDNVRIERQYEVKKEDKTTPEVAFDLENTIVLDTPVLVEKEEEAVENKEENVQDEALVKSSMEEARIKELQKRRELILAMFDSVVNDSKEESYAKRA